MDFDEILEQTIALLKRQGRVSYRALKVRFDLDDDYLEALKEEILFAYPVVDEDGRGLVRTGEVESPGSDTRHQIEGERHVQALLPAVILLLQHDKRVTSQTLQYVFGLDDTLLEAIRQELILRRLTGDEAGDILVWTGEAQSTTVAALPDTPQATTLPPSATPESTHLVQEAERRQLTVMFCDLADSTRLSQQLDPEDLREVVRAYQATAAEIIQQYDGHMAQYLGDGLLVYFGWPVAHEDDAQRAAHTALGIVEAITWMLNPRLQADKGIQLTVRIGIHTGAVVVGEMGGGEHYENLAIGETVNIAARLEGLAAPNTVVLSPVTARLVAGAFALEDLGQHALKGVAEAMSVFRVLSSTAVEQEGEESLPDGGMFLVGRDEEVGLLLRRWEQSKEGLGQVVLISGEAGIGKSSLLTAIRSHVADEGYTRLTFRCSPYHTNSVLYPVIAHLEQLLGFESGDTPDTKLDKLEQALRRTSLTLQEAVPLLAALLSVPCEDRYLALTVSPQQQRRQTLDTLVGLLLGEAEQRLVLALWEDLHWADPSTLEMLGLLLEQTPTVSMLHVLTFRPEFVLPWSTRSHMTPITLNRLERPQVEAVIGHQAGGKKLPRDVIEHIVTKTDGVPLYVEELTKMLLDSDLLRQEGEQYVLTGPLTSVAIPDTLQDSLMARLDQLGSAKEIAQLGAVCGREFPYDLLQAVLPLDEEALQVGLARLIEAELLYQRGRAPRARYLFKHALIQDAAYASLLRSTRQQVHQRVAQVLETQFPETVETQPELLAHHYTEANVLELAIDYWQRAGERAFQRSSLSEATAHVAKGIELLEKLPQTVARSEREIRLRLALGQALFYIRGYSAPEVEQNCLRLRELCQQADDQRLHISTLAALRRHYNGRGEHRKGIEVSEEALRLAQDIEDPELLAGGHYDLAVTLFYRGMIPLAQEHLTKSLAISESQGDLSVSYRFGGASLQAMCHTYAYTALWRLGYPEQAQHRYEQALQVSQHARPVIQGFAQLWKAFFHAVRREWSRLDETSTRLVAFATEQGLPQVAAGGKIMLGWWRVVLDQDSDGIIQLRQGIEDFQNSGGELFRPYWLTRLAEAYAQLGKLEDALGMVAEAFDVIHRTEEYLHHPDLCRLNGLLLLASSEEDEAETSFHQALEVARSQQAKSLELRAATSLAHLWQKQGKSQAAYDLLLPVYEWFTEGFDTADLQEAKKLLCELVE